MKMQKDTVLLDIEKYNELRDFKQKIEEGKTIIIVSGWDHYTKKFITTEKAVEEIAEANKLLQKENEYLRKAEETNKVTLNEIKKMSYWEFRKWRKS
jgi:hypothetical protein